MIEYCDGHDIHYSVEVYQSAQDTKISCGKVLSTWAVAQPDNKYSHLPKPACDVGYTFTAEEVDCPECRMWVEEHCPSCKKCGVKCTYGTCRKCVEKEIEEVGFEEWKKHPERY